MFDVRPIGPDEVDLFRSRLSRAFGGDADPDEEARERFDAIFELDRTLGVFQGEDLIGTGGAFSLQVSVPGGAQVPMGGTTVVSVQPTHRRQGALRAFMERHLEDVAEHEEPVAGLWASESSIYGRFGYGPATYSMTTEIDARTTTFRDQSDKGLVRLFEPDEAGPLIKTVYEEARTRRAGMISRSEAWWKHRIMADPSSRRGSRSSLRFAVFQEDGQTTGYAIYRQKENWEDFLSKGEIEVTEIIAVTDNALSGLWGFLTNIDLFPDLEWWNTPVDDPLIHMVTDPRRVQPSIKDALWIRLIDVPAALNARSYESDGVVTIEVADRTRPETSGIYRLECSEGAGLCQRVGDGADISMDIDVLGHLYLGGGTALGMAAAGRIEGDPAAVSTLHRLFRADRAPWCPEIF